MADEPEDGLGDDVSMVAYEGTDAFCVHEAHVGIVESMGETAKDHWYTVGMQVIGHWMSGERPPENEENEEQPGETFSHYYEFGTQDARLDLLFGMASSVLDEAHFEEFKTMMTVIGRERSEKISAGEQYQPALFKATGMEDAVPPGEQPNGDNT